MICTRKVLKRYLSYLNTDSHLVFKIYTEVKLLTTLL